MSKMHEELLEPWFRDLRFRRALPDLPRFVDVCVDIGCGPKIPFYHFLKKAKVVFNKYIGIDPLLQQEVIDSYRGNDSVKLYATVSDQIKNIIQPSVDLVTGFAFLEHIDDPGTLLSDAISILKPGGMAIFTTPSHLTKPVLEFLSFKLGLVSRREIAEHKNYFSKKDLLTLLPSDMNTQTLEVKHAYFEFGFNNYLVIKKHEEKK